MATRKDPYRNYKFIVDIEPAFGRAGFSNVEGLTKETEVIEYREGGDPSTMRKIPGQTSYENIVLQRGMSDDGDFQAWYNQIFKRRGGSVPLADNNDLSADVLQPPNDEFRRNVTISLIDKAGVIRKVWRIFDAWPCKLEHDTLDARDTGDVFIETLELCHEGWIEETL